MLDLDATDIPLYGRQPERFFHGYYDSYCYLPLYIFAGDQLVCDRLRPSNVDGAAGELDEVKRIVAQLSSKLPKVRIVLRCDSGFCRDRIDGDMHLRPLAPFGSVIAGPRAALRRRLQGAAVKTNRRGLAFRPFHSRSSDCTSTTKALKTPRQRPHALLTMLYRSTDRLCRCGAPV